MNECTFLGFDYGNKKTGIAIGQNISNTATPLDTISTHPKEALWETIEKLIAQWKPNGFVLGVPMTEQINNHPVIPAILKFARKLHNKYQKPVYLVDERLSSYEAKQRLSPSYKKNKKQRKTVAIDSMAAKIILETWLKNPHNQLHLETLEDALKATSEKTL